MITASFMSRRALDLPAAMLLGCLVLATANLSCSRREATPAKDGSPTILTNQSGLSMVVLAGGCFEMGTAAGESDETLHRVCVSPFAIDQYEVTQKSFKELMGSNPSRWTELKNPVE